MTTKTKLWPNGSTAIPRVTSEFNPARRNPATGIIQPHTGIDLVGFAHNLASDAGTVTFARYNGGAGNEVRVRHDDGSETRYKHNKSFLVREGQRVSRGQALGVQGTTGTSTGVHCHFETRDAPSGLAINPRTWMSIYVLALAPAGSGIAPLMNGKKDDMRQVFGTNGAGYVQTDQGFAGEGSPQIHNLFWRVINSDQTKNPFNNTGMPDQFNLVEINMMDSFLRLMVVSNLTGVRVDNDKLAAALSDELIKKGLPPVRATLSDEEIKKIHAGEQINTGITNEQLGAAFDVAIPRVAKALFKAQADALSAASK